MPRDSLRDLLAFLAVAQERSSPAPLPPCPTVSPFGSAPPMRCTAVTAPQHLSGRTPPAPSQDPTRHRCLNLRLHRHCGLWDWKSAKGGRLPRVKVQRSRIASRVPQLLPERLNWRAILTNMLECQASIPPSPMQHSRWQPGHRTCRLAGPDCTPWTLSPGHWHSGSMPRCAKRF